MKRTESEGGEYISDCFGVVWQGNPTRQHRQGAFKIFQPFADLLQDLESRRDKGSTSAIRIVAPPEWGLGMKHRSQASHGPELPFGRGPKPGWLQYSLAWKKSTGCRWGLATYQFVSPLDKGGLRGVHSGEISDEAILAAGLQARKCPFSILFQRGRGLGNPSRQNWWVV